MLEAFDYRNSTRDSGALFAPRPPAPPGAGALTDLDVFRPRSLRALTALESHGLSLPEIVEAGTRTRGVVEEVSFPSLARMNPKPLSLTSRLIVPFIGAMKYSLHPFRSKRGKSILAFGPIAIR